MTNSLSRIAGGTINPFTFIQGQPGVMLGALQCTGGGVPIIGVGAEWTSAMMGQAIQTTLIPQGFPAAASGQSIRVYEDGENTVMMVGSGFTVMPDDLLKSDASGNAIPVSTAAGIQYVGARAIEAGVAGDVIRVQVYTRFLNTATS